MFVLVTQVCHSHLNLALFIAFCVFILLFVDLYELHSAQQGSYFHNVVIYLEQWLRQIDYEKLASYNKFHLIDKY